jgi:hypothetical protein
MHKRPIICKGIDPKIGFHPSLARQQRGATAAADLKPLNIVCEHVVQITNSILAGRAQLTKKAEIESARLVGRAS